MKPLSFLVAAVLVAALGGTTSRANSPAPASAAAPTAEPAGRWHDASLDEYRTHLQDLTAVVEACANARDTKTCDATKVGEDDRVPLSNATNAERRLVRYGWLRILIAKARDKDAVEPAAKPAIAAPDTPAEATIRPPRRTTTELLQDAQARLAQDMAQADNAANTPPAIAPAHDSERETMKQVLAGKDFKNLEAPDARDSVLEKFGAWLNRFFESLGKLQAQSAWVGRALVWGFILVVCVGLVWGLLQLERRWRIRLVPESDGPAAGAASARDWQLWLADARIAASQGRWREAVHFVYWATISRLESRRLWPADRARTPREYLSLVANDDPRRAGLATLTGSFERTWYGGRPAAEGDYQKAEELATGLISGHGAADSAQGGGR